MGEKMEQWKKIEGFPNYEISNMGNVRNVSKGNILKPSKHKDKGYYIVFLYQNGKSKVKVIHRLVATYFIPNPDGKPNVRHVNHDKLDNRADNLRWATHDECVLHSPKSRRNASLTEEQEMEVKDRLLEGETGTVLAVEFQTSEMTISRIRKKYRIGRR